MRVDIKAPLTKEEAAKLRAGDIVSLTGYIYIRAGTPPIKEWWKALKKQENSRLT